MCFYSLQYVLGFSTLLQSASDLWIQSQPCWWFVLIFRAIPCFFWASGMCPTLSGCLWLWGRWQVNVLRDWRQSLTFPARCLKPKCLSLKLCVVCCPCLKVPQVPQYLLHMWCCWGVNVRCTEHGWLAPMRASWGYPSVTLLSRTALWEVKPGTCCVVLGLLCTGWLLKQDLFVDVRPFTALCFYAAFHKR